MSGGFSDLFSATHDTVDGVVKILSSPISLLASLVLSAAAVGHALKDYLQRERQERDKENGQIAHNLIVLISNVRDLVEKVGRDVLNNSFVKGLKQHKEWALKYEQIQRKIRNVLEEVTDNKTDKKTGKEGDTVIRLRRKDIPRIQQTVQTLVVDLHSLLVKVRESAQREESAQEEQTRVPAGESNGQEDNNLERQEALRTIVACEVELWALLAG